MNSIQSLFLILLLVTAGLRAEQPLWDAGKVLAPGAAGAWQPKTSTLAPDARGAADGIVFPVPGRTESERLVWDTACAFAFQLGACLELEFSVDHPEAIRQITVYFAQGNGWRTATIGLLHRGWNRVVIPLSQFAAEGAPAPGPTTLFRLALVPSRSGDATVRLHRLRAAVPDVLLLQGRSVSQPAVDRANSLRTVNLLHDWLADAGVAHAMLTDQDLASGIAPATRVLITAAINQVNPPTLEAARQLLARGGKVMVCGGRDPALADLLNMETGTAQQTTSFGSFASFALPAADGQSVVIHDHNWEIAPARPKPGLGKVAALWQDARGRNRFEPALTTSNRGWWFAFPFHAGDQRRKQDLLVRMIGDVSAGSLADAARSRSQRARRAGPYVGVDELRQAAAKAGGSRQAALDALLNQAETFETATRETLQRHLHGHAYAAAARLESRLENAYALLQGDGQAAELRGVWDHNGVGLYPGGWNATCEMLAANGFNAVFPNLLWAGKAHYRSRSVPASKTCEQHGDQLTACTEAAARHGLRVHVWKVCWQLGGTDSPLYQTFKNAGRLQKDRNGEIVPWLCPSQLENVNWEVATVSELARRAGITGIHLDYVRYPEGGGCFCDHTRAAFERYIDRSVKNWPRDAATGGPDAAAFTRFKADEMSRFVGRVHSTVRGINPKLQLSAAVWGKYPQCIDSVAQDWGRWLREGTVDFLTPMNYTQDPHQYAGWLDDQLALDGAEGRIFPGIGAISTECELAPDEIIEQIMAGRRRKLPGYVLFKLDPVLVDRAFPYLRLAQ